MKIIGITGPTGAGKSLLSEYLSERGIPVIDADAVYHAMLIPPSPCLDALRVSFGDSIFCEDGSLNRPALSAIVFHDEEKLRLLNRTVLDIVLDRIRTMILEYSQQGENTVAVDAPTLIESGFHRECDTVISVLSPSEIRMKRIMERDGITEERAKERIDAQQPDSFYREHSDYVLINSADRESFFAQGDALLRDWKPSN